MTTPRREKFLVECKYFGRVLVRKLSRVNFNLLKLEHRKQEIQRDIKEIEDKMQKYSRTDTTV